MLLTIIMVIILLASSLNLTTYSLAYSKSNNFAQNPLNGYQLKLLIRNLGGEYSEFNESKIWSKFSVDKASLISILLEIAKLIEEYNQSLADEIREITQLIYAGNISEAYEKYVSLLPYIEEAIEEIYNIDPELAHEILSLIKLTGCDVKYPGGQIDIFNIPNFPGININNLVSLPSNVVSTSYTANQYIFIAAILVIIFVSTILFRKWVMRYVSPAIKSRIDKLVVKLKLGRKPNDPRGIIIFNYKLLLYLLQRVGVFKKDYETPREFLSRVSLNIKRQCHELTMLFEKARYSHKEITIEEAERSNHLISQIEGLIHE